ncbi:hypothetical protein HHI36_004180 [Cryptolaemus montrouzieri]|uniref:Sensory neuron membrane protein 2 n=1 Tax=Cryptolaemus montrouzieri TaxID=559131 RepID=A0ABD2NS18_9CUCU
MLVRGTDQWHRFKQLPFNLTYNVSIFEVSNAEDVINKGDRPNLTEKGPYVYDEIIRKVNIVFNEDNETITYQRKTELYFNQEISGPNLSENDTVKMINPAYVAILQMVKMILPEVILITTKKGIQSCMNAMFEDGLLMTNYTVRQLLFDGYKICDFNNKKCTVLGISLCKEFINRSKSIEEVIDKTTNEHYMKFSFLNYKIDLFDGVYNVETGTEDINEVGNIKNWDYSNYSTFWGEDHNTCNVIKGTDGTLYAPHVTEDSQIYAYSTDICRNTKMEYNGPGSYKDIEGYYFRTSPTMFNSSDPPNDCFCINQTMGVDGKPTCFLDGVMDMYPCMGAPVLLSYPHFLYANPKYVNALDGDIKPDPKKHELFVLLDKYLGVPLEGHKRAQMNIVLRPISEFKKVTGKLPQTVLPIIWIDEGLELPPVGMDMINNLFYNTLKLVNILKWTFIGITFGLTVISCILLYNHLYSS